MQSTKQQSTSEQLALTLLVLTLLLYLPATQAGHFHLSCNNVATAQWRSCQNEVMEESWNSVATCINESGEGGFYACLAETYAEKSEARELCGDQFEARLDICDSLDNALYTPELDPNDFLSPEAAAANPHPYFPLTPGLVLTYEAGDETIVVTVTDEVKEIAGIEATVIRDTVSEDGELIEDTFDWYAQDIHGNVWYLGELSKNYEDGELVDLEGSWKTGVDGARAGIIMQAMPEVGQIYRQEYLIGEAEDMAEVFDTNETGESAPAANCASTCLVTREYLPIEPDVEAFKYYAPGIGMILEIDGETGAREEELVDIQLP